MRPLLAALALTPLVLGLNPATASAQRAGQVDTLALLLAAEDARRDDRALFAAALGSGDPLVRRRAVLAVGRVAGAPGLATAGLAALLLPRLDDRDPHVRASAAFALGLVRDSVAIPALVARLGGVERDPNAAAEVVLALARIGGPAAGEALQGLLRRPPTRGTGALQVREAYLHAWRLGAHAPVAQLLAVVRAGDADARWRAVYSLGRLREPRAEAVLRVALEDGDARVRATAARAFTRAYADTAGLRPEDVTRMLARLVEDRDPAVRVQAMSALATFCTLAGSAGMLRQLGAREPHVALQAAQALGASGAPEASVALDSLLDADPWLALAREALGSLARLDTARLARQLPRWAAHPDPYAREAAARAAAVARLGAGALAPLAADSVRRVAVAALAAWRDVDAEDPALHAAARARWADPDAAVRAAAVAAAEGALRARDLPTLAALLRRAEADGGQGMIAIATAMATVARRDSAGSAAFVRDSLGALPHEHLLRAWARSGWPAAAAAWGPPYPIAPARSADDYRELVRRHLLPGSPARRPRATIALARGERLVVELHADEAPLTVANFLAYAGDGFFDGNRWHRVVPDFVVQDGEPEPGRRPRPAIRDEFTRLRYGPGVLGMALAGPDTGTSQWFLTLSAQPHLDGGYTAFGRVVGGAEVPLRVVPGDRIGTIR